MDLVSGEGASARSDEPEARSDARWRVRPAAAGGGLAAAAVDGAAALAAPALASLAGGNGGDDESGERVGPPPAEGGVESQSDEESSGEVGAEEVLAAFAVPGAGPELAGDVGFGAGEQRHRDQRDDREADPDRAAAGVIAAGEGDGRVDGDVCGKQPEGDRDELLGASLGVLGVGAGVVEAPEDDDPGERFDQRVRAERDQCDRPGGDAGADRDGGLNAVPREPEAREEAGAGLEPSPLAGRGRGLGGPRSGGSR